MALEHATLIKACLGIDRKTGTLKMWLILEVAIGEISLNTDQALMEQIFREAECWEARQLTGRGCLVEQDEEKPEVWRLDKVMANRHPPKKKRNPLT